MIEAKNLTKWFEQIVAIDHTNATIRSSSVFGLTGTNGTGKSTFLRTASEVLEPNEGSITIDGEPVLEDTRVKPRFSYISSDQFFFNNAIPDEMMFFYMTAYPKFDKMCYIHLMGSFGLGRKQKINTFSKGMKRQVSAVYGVCVGMDYLLCDETFDGLGPMMRQTVKNISVRDMQGRNLTPAIVSRSLRELEGICNHAGLLHEGGILLSKDLDGMKLNIHRTQCVLKPNMEPEDLVVLDKVRTERRGSLCTLTVRGIGEEVGTLMANCHPVFAEIIPLSSGEVFISETEVAGYDIKKLAL